MASITAADIKKLREATGAGMTDCKNALVEADGDYDKAVESLRIKGLKGVAKREGRAASNGLVIAKLDGTTKGTLLELNCETDFVAKSAKFQELAEPGRRRRRSAATTSRRCSRRGRRQAAVTTSSTTPTRSMGEKIEVRRVATFEGAYVAVYLHKTNPDLPPQLGVLVELSGENADVAKDVAQHIAAFAPTYVSRDRGPRGRRRQGARDRRGDREGGGQARGRPPQDRRGSRQRLLQGAGPARAGLRQGQQEDRRQGPRGGRRHS